MKQEIKKLVEKNRSAFYVFDIGTLRKRISYLKSHLPSEIDLCYAVKANTFIAKEIEDDVERFEICSPGEAVICTSLGIQKKKMVISGINKDEKNIESLVADSEFDGVFTAESVLQYNMLCKLAGKYQKSLRVLLRLTNDSQFGMNESDIEAIISEQSRHPKIEHIGIQFFSGTQKASIKKIKREIEYVDSFLIRLKEDYEYEAKEFEYGSGFPVSYFDSDAIDEEEIFDNFSQIIKNMVCKPHITLELGRSIAASCGQYYTHIVDIKKNKGQNYVLVDGGMNHIVYFGQYMAMKHPYLSVVGKTDMDKDNVWTICGSLCSMNDIIAKQISLPTIEVGDTICFENTGAYCMTEGISLFLSRDLPAIYLIQENGSIICARDTYETEQLNTPHYERML